MKKLFLLLIFSLCFSSCYKGKLQVMSQATYNNSENVKLLLDDLKVRHPDNDFLQKLSVKTIQDLSTSEKALLMKKGFLTADDLKGLVSQISPFVKVGVKMASSYFGVSPVMTETALMFILGLLGLGAGKKGVNIIADKRKKRETILAESNPEDAKKLL